MSRIHDRTPVLKTLFVIKTFKPGTKEWSSLPIAALENTALTIQLHDDVMAEYLFDDDYWPPYIIQAYTALDIVGALAFKDTDGKKVNPVDVLKNPTFTGVNYALELDPRWKRSDVLEDLYARLKTLADNYLELNDMKIDFDEAFCWMGAQQKGLVNPYA